MAGIKRISSHRAGEGSIIYSNMRGVDMSGDGSNISRGRFSYLENMYRDYDSRDGSAIESIPGFRILDRSYTGRVNGIYSHKSKDGKRFLLLHVGERILRMYTDNLDEVTVPMVGSAANSKSASAPLGDGLIILDGENLIYSTDEGLCYKVYDGGDRAGYIPTTYLNGKRHEQRNLLTRSFKEKHVFGSPDKYSFGSDGLVYEIFDEEEALARITAYSGADASVFVPSYITIGNTSYAVKEIANDAFRDNTAITRVKIAEGVYYIGKQAFSGCASLISVIMPDTVTEIGSGCFNNCAALTELHFGRATERLGNSLISQCHSLSEISYSGSAEDFSLIENTSVISGKSVLYDTPRREIRIKIEVCSPCAEISSLTVGEASVSFTSHKDSSGLVDYVTADFDDKNLLGGAKITLLGTLSPDRAHYLNGGGFLGSEFFSDGDSPEKIISGCRIAETYDGRVFLSGNPKYPSCVFYSTRAADGDGALYFGDYDYFCDGSEGFGITSLLAASSSLIVFKEGDDGAGSVFYHTPRETGVDFVPKIYPTSYIHGGIRAYGASASFFDDTVFICDGGLCALEKEKTNLSRSVSVRSSNVNAGLLSEDLSSALLTKWQGYLVLAVGERIYLADSRATFTNESGGMEYEWFYLSGIGAYTADVPVYRYSAIPTGDFEINEALADCVCQGVVSSSVFPDAKLRYYTTAEDGTKYEVYPTEERTGGTFHKLSAVHGVDNLLFFGTEGGHICLFNTDKRGVAPECERASEDFDEAEYKRCFGRAIHSSFYSFAGHAPRYALVTPYDNCDYPHLTKSTVKGSLTVKFKTYSRGEINLEVGTDTESYKQICKIPSAALSFSDVDFGGLSLASRDAVTVSIGEKEKGWVEKQISLFSEQAYAPIGIYSIAYRFRVKGKIKNNR